MGVQPLNTKIKKETTQVRPLHVIADEIRKDWLSIYFGAKPYLEAMRTLDKISESYGVDSGKSIVLYFLANATSWRGDVARNIKKELNAMAK